MLAMKMIRNITESSAARGVSYTGSEDHYKALTELHSLVDLSSKDVVDAIKLSYIQFAMPIVVVIQLYINKKTNRVWIPSMIDMVMDVILCIAIIIMVYLYGVLKVPIADNHTILAHDLDVKEESLFMLNSLWCIDNPSQSKVWFRTDLVLSLIVLCYWVKLVFVFKISKTFGPLFKIFEKMTIDLFQFLGLWILNIFLFASFSIIAFSKNEFFHDFREVIVYMFSASLGSWDMSINVVEGGTTLDMDALIG